MDSIFFERQESLMCGQHALNMLLQGEYYNPITLGDIARKLDSLERHFMSAQPNSTRSENMNEYGFFSIQVLTEALKNFDIEIYHLSHPAVSLFRQNPQKARAYICNLQQHWFTLRKFGEQWFELNSIKTGPKFISDTYLEIYIEQLVSEGYNIYVVNGILPECKADAILSACPYVPPPTVPPQPKPKPGTISKIFSGVGRRLGFDSSGSSSRFDEDEQLAIALAASMESAHQVTNQTHNAGEDEDEMLRLAIEMSRQDEQNKGGNGGEHASGSTDRGDVYKMSNNEELRPPIMDIDDFPEADPHLIADRVESDDVDVKMEKPKMQSELQGCTSMQQTVEEQSQSMSRDEQMRIARESFLKSLEEREKKGNDRKEEEE